MFLEKKESWTLEALKHYEASKFNEELSEILITFIKEVSDIPAQKLALKKLFSQKGISSEKEQKILEMAEENQLSRRYLVKFMDFDT
jgi:uncharacterized protein YutD